MGKWQFILFFPFVCFVGIVVFLSILFPPQARGLKFVKIPQEYPIISFNPKVDTNIARRMETGLKRKNGEYLEDGTDLNKLAYAVARHETANCTKGSGKYNNCHGIIRNGGFVRYSTKEESYKDFKQLWKKWYKKFPDYELAHRYSGGDRTNEWIYNVTKFYHEQN